MPKTYNIIIDSAIGWPVSKDFIRSKLSDMKGKPVTVRISSLGGDTATAFDIRQQFLDHGDVTAYIYGMTASAATILATGAKRIVMSRYALMLVHQCSGAVFEYGYYNKEQLESAISDLLKKHADLSKVDGVIASVYAAKTGAAPEDMADLMAKAEWLNADECLKLGLIDEIIEESGETPQSITDSMREQFVACGHPIPDLQPAVKTEAQPTSDNLFDRIREFFRKEPQPTNTMEQKPIKFTSICGLLQMDALQVGSDQSVQISSEQMQKIEDHLAELEKEKNASGEHIKALESELKKLKDEDGADTDTVDPADNDSENIPGAEAAAFFAKYREII